MQLLSVVSHSCVLAHAPPENLEGCVPCPVHHHAAWEHGSGLRGVRGGPNFLEWGLTGQGREGGVQGRQITKQPGGQLNIASDKHH